MQITSEVLASVTGGYETSDAQKASYCRLLDDALSSVQKQSPAMNRFRGSSIEYYQSRMDDLDCRTRMTNAGSAIKSTPR